MCVESCKYCWVLNKGHEYLQVLASSRWCGTHPLLLWERMILVNVCLNQFSPLKQKGYTNKYFGLVDHILVYRMLYQPTLSHTVS